MTKFVNSAITVLCPPAEVEGVFQSPGLMRGPDPTELPPSPEKSVKCFTTGNFFDVWNG